MNSPARVMSVDTHTAGQEMSRLIAELYPICRSITGNGVRETLQLINQHIPLAIREVPTGTQVFDWMIPKEWNIRDAYVKNSKGDRVIDFRKSNLHVVSYSVPVHRKISLKELKEHLFTLPDHPEWIPYRTSYYKQTWGFCLAHDCFLGLKEDEYEVLIDSSLEDGSLTYGEYFVAGESPDEVLVSTHVCHPSLCNDNLSGVALSTFLAKYLAERPRRYSYRFVFIPGTIGSITWLCLNESHLSKIKHGLVVVCVGDPGKFTYKHSRQGDAEIDKAVIHVLRNSESEYDVVDFYPYGYDERQYCSPGFDLPVGVLSRTPHSCFPEYHTSADNLNFIRPECLADSLAKYSAVLDVLENNRKFLNKNPKCEPQLGKRGLYSQIGGDPDGKTRELAMLWVLNLSDGKHTLLDIAERSGLAFGMIWKAAEALRQHELLQECAR